MKPNMSAWLRSFCPGEVTFVEVTAKDAAREQQRIQARASELGIKFKTKTLTAVGSIIGDVTYLLRVERVLEEV